MNSSDETEYHIKSFAIRSSRMRDSQKLAYQEFGGDFLLSLGKAPFSSPSVFGNGKPLVAEIGFGMGDASLEIAVANQETNYIGIEVHRPGIGKLLGGIGKSGIANMRIIEGDAAVAFPVAFADSSLAGIHVFFPDPWPKARHHKRRLIQTPFATLLAQKLIPGGYLYFVTDWEEYAEWSLKALSAVPALRNEFPGYAPHRDWRPLTKFEKKGAAQGRPSFELYFVRSDSAAGPSGR
jgi:tRNA (guanine-N7-)-methyltransferase